MLKGKNGIVRGHVLAPMQYHYLNTQGWFNSKNVLKLKFEDLIGEKGGGFAFMIFAFAMLIQFFVVSRWFPETKGKSLEELQKEISRKR